MAKNMNGLTFDTTLRISLDEGDTEREIGVMIDYSYFPAVPAYTPAGEYAPIDPPEPASVEIGNVRLWLGDQQIDCPPFIAQLVDSDECLYRALIDDAENSASSWDGQPTETEEWLDFDRDC